MGRTARRNLPWCIKIVKWFYAALVERLESFGKLACGRHVPNENKRLSSSRKKATQQAHPHGIDLSSETHF
jgi:hypothetical protein